jgi:hypothetical protein
MALAMGVTYACSDRIAAPVSGDGNDYFLTGPAFSSLWRVEGASLSYLGSASSQVTVGRTGTELTHHEGDVRAFSLAPASAKATQVQLEASAPMLQLGSFAPADRSIGTGVTGILRDRSVAPKQIKVKANGRDLAIRYIEDSRPGHRPPVAAMIYDGRRAVSLNEYTYVKEGQRWRPSYARVTMFDSAGKAVLVATHDMSSVRAQFGERTGMMNHVGERLSQMGASLSRLVQPDVLHAADVCDETPDSPCWHEAIMLGVATSAEAAGVLGVVAAYATCPATAGLTCLAGLAAQAALAALDLALGVALADYLICKRNGGPNATAKIPANPAVGITPNGRSADCIGGGTGGGDLGGYGCYTEIWEISYDGGQTWQYYTTIWVCPNQI